MKNIRETFWTSFIYPYTNSLLVYAKMVIIVKLHLNGQCCCYKNFHTAQTLQVSHCPSFNSVGVHLIPIFHLFSLLHACTFPRAKWSFHRSTSYPSHSSLYKDYNATEFTILGFLFDFWWFFKVSAEINLKTEKYSNCEDLCIINHRLEGLTRKIL